MQTKFAIPTLSFAALLLAAPCLFAQETGVSHPETLNDTLTTVPPAPATSHYVKPSAGIPISMNAPSAPVYQAPAPLPPPPARSMQYEQTPTPAPVLHAHEEPAPLPRLTVDRSLMVTDDDPNSGVVIEVPSGPNELPIGTMLHARLLETISTRDTATGTRFSAKLTHAVYKHGEILLPAGTIISGRITQIHGGRRTSGPAAIRLQPDIVKLPNGMAYELEADVIDLEHYQGAHVNGEGAIIGNEDKTQTATTFGATTGGGALIGAMVGGPVGAVAGAGIGAGIGTVVWLQRDRQEILSSGTGVIFSLNRPLQLHPTGF